MQISYDIAIIVLGDWKYASDYYRMAGLSKDWFYISYIIDESISWKLIVLDHATCLQMFLLGFTLAFGFL